MNVSSSIQLGFECKESLQTHVLGTWVPAGDDILGGCGIFGTSYAAQRSGGETLLPLLSGIPIPNKSCPPLVWPTLGNVSMSGSTEKAAQSGSQAAKGYGRWLLDSVAAAAAAAV